MIHCIFKCHDPRACEVLSCLGKIHRGHVTFNFLGQLCERGTDLTDLTIVTFNFLYQL
jgi:hypothetical protein